MVLVLNVEKYILCNTNVDLSVTEIGKMSYKNKEYSKKIDVYAEYKLLYENLLLNFNDKTSNL